MTTANLAAYEPLTGLMRDATALQTALVNAELHLTKASFVGEPELTLADLTAIEADYTGYAAATIAAYAGPFVDDANTAVLVSPGTNFAPSGTAVLNTIYGGWVETAAGVLMYTFLLDVPFTQENTTALFDLTHFVRLPGPGYFDLET